MVTCFRDGWYFDEIAGKRRDLFKILNVPVPTMEQSISDTAESDDEPTIATLDLSEQELENMEGETL